MNQKIIKFAFVGGIGFIVDFSSMFLLSTVFPLFPARLLAFFIALNSNWLLNRNFTFRNQAMQRSTSLIQQWTKFVISSCLGAVPNLVCYWGIIHIFNPAGITAIVAIIPGILLGMIVNFLLADKWVFRPVSTKC